VKGHLLAEMTYEECEKYITEDSIIALPIGGAIKEHGYQLPMGTDYYVTEWFAQKVAEKVEGVIVLPTLPYAYFPAFATWKGTVSIGVENFVNMVEDIIMNYARFGLWKFLIIDDGVGTYYGNVTLARDLNNKHNIKVAVTNCTTLGIEVDEELCEQKSGGHGCEAETSTMLYVKEELVRMDRAVEEYTRTFPWSSKIHFPQRITTVSGINGNPTFATKEKGEKMMHAKLDDIIVFLEGFKKFTKADIEK